MITISDFDMTNCKEIKIEDGFIKSIFAEKCRSFKDAELEGNTIELTTGCNAMIEFINGYKILITNSEWGSITIIK